MNIPKGATHYIYSIKLGESQYLKIVNNRWLIYHDRLWVDLSDCDGKSWADYVAKEIPIEQINNNDNVNSPTHYTQGKVECIDAIESATVGKSGFEAYCVGNVIKYLWRYEEKGSKESVEKSQWYLKKLLDSITE